MPKRAFYAAIALIAIMALVGASSSLSSPSKSSAGLRSTKGYSVWFVDGFSFVPAWQRMEKQFKKEAARLGDKATVVGMSALDPAKMVSDMDQAIAAHANAILFCDVDPKVFTAEIAKARKAGIVVTTTIPALRAFAISDLKTLGSTSQKRIAFAWAAIAWSMSLTIFAGSSADIPTTVALSPSLAASRLNCCSIFCQAGTNENPSTNHTL